MYYAKHTQEDARTELVATVSDVYALVQHWEWEDTEWELWEFHGGHSWPTEFPCTYFHSYEGNHFDCSHTANRPDSLCPFHAGEED